MRARLALVLPALSAVLIAQGSLTLPLSLISVRVHPDEAWITRAGSVRVERAGIHRINVQGLPANLRLEDIRISAKGPEGSRLGDVSVSSAQLPDAAAAQESKVAQTHIEALRSQRNGLEARREAAIQSLAFLKALQAVQAKEGQDRVATAQPLAVGYLDLARGFQAHTADLLAEEKRLAFDLEKLGLEQRRLEVALRGHEIALVRSTSTVSLELDVARAGMVEITLTNRTREARWKPSYEARFSPDLKRMELVLFAAVSQRTFEAWASVPVELSTVPAQRKMVMPAFLGPANLGWTAPEPVPPPLPNALPPAASPGSSPTGYAGMRGGVIASGVMSDRTMGEIPAVQVPMPMLESAATALQRVTGMAATFRIPVASVAADAVWHRFRVQAQILDPTLHHVVSPRLDPTVFQVARFTLPSAFPSFPGCPVVAFLGDERLPECALDASRRGEPLELNLGPFEGLRTSLDRLDEKNPYRLTRLTLRRTRAGAARQDEIREEVATRGRERIWTLDERILASNETDEARELEVLDRVVASTHESVKVDLRAEPEAPKPESPNLRRWKLQVPPRGTATLALGLTVRGPKEGSLHGLEQLGLTED